MSVLVTGAGSGIGRATARLLAERAFKVAVTDVDEDAARRVAEELGSFGTALDVTSRQSIREAMDEAEEAIGPLDGLVANAGVSSFVTFLDMPDADWHRMLDVNTTGVFYCGQEFAKRLVAAKRPGSIVNVASMAAKQGRIPWLSHYVASKFAVVGLTQSMAFELAPHGIRVNSVCPGYVATSMQDRELVWEGELRGIAPAQVFELYIKDTPLGRIETAEDVARAIAFLLGPDSAFITGEALSVNGGAFMD
ncbi:MAG: SDR family NAD(P)-dependent oxidoreductase [Acidimicrobiales bacterium]|jgi:NAD(P)-dependent dehydrogenase (short-subunit alcohol dehydrogenase family)